MDLSWKKPLTSLLGYTHTLDVETATRNREFWATRSELSETTRQSIRTADIILVPEGESFRGAGPYFPEGTVDFFEFSKSKDSPVEIATEDENFTAGARPSALYYFGELLLKDVALPVFATLLAEYIKNRFLDPKQDAIRIGITLEKADGSVSHVNYARRNRLHDAAIGAEDRGDFAERRGRLDARTT